MIRSSVKRIIISRTDSIGDVMLTLPICAWLKSHLDDVYIIFLGKGYTKDIVQAYDLVDQFEDWNKYTADELQAPRMLDDLKADAIIHVFPNKQIAWLSKKAGIPFRIGTSHRLFHRWTCNYRVNFTRKRSELHEAQLNHELLRPFGLDSIPSLEEIFQTTNHLKVPDIDLPKELEDLSTITILHPKSQGSAKEWPIDKYMDLAERITHQSGYVVFTGTESEGALFREYIPDNDRIIDTTGKLSLKQLMKLIAAADNLVACSTGPLHIAGYYGTNTIGLFSPKRPIHPGRWQAIGKQVNILVYDPNCPKCARGADCSCIEEISVEEVYNKLNI